MRIGDLSISSSDYDIPWEVLRFPENTVRFLKVFGPFRHVGTYQESSLLDLSCIQAVERNAFLETHSQSLRTVFLDGMVFKFTDVLPSLGYLQELYIDDSLLEGWEILCKSCHSLKSLDLVNVKFTTISESPACVIPSLERLFFMYELDSEQLAAPWLDANARSFPGLRELEVRAISAETMAAFIVHCPKLEVLVFGPDNHQSVSFPSDEHLQVFSRCTSRLRTLNISHGRFSSIGIDKFLASLPVSLEVFNITGSYGFTIVHFQRLLKLPLRELCLGYMPIPRARVQELLAFAQHESPATLSLLEDHNDSNLVRFTFDKKRNKK
jgi:hypothetical protein